MAWMGWKSILKLNIIVDWKKGNSKNESEKKVDFFRRLAMKFVVIKLCEGGDTRWIGKSRESRTHRRNQAPRIRKGAYQIVFAEQNTDEEKKEKKNSRNSTSGMRYGNRGGKNEGNDVTKRKY